MVSNKRKILKKRSSQKIIDGETLREYQESTLFKMGFQESEMCYIFRRAWHVPPDGFDDHESYIIFHSDLQEKDLAYVKTEKYLKRHTELIKKRRAWANGKVTDGELEFAERNFVRFVPSIKYNEDIDYVVRKSKKPIYWRGFIEECLLFKNVNPTLVMRPLPEPKLSWSNYLQRNELTIENIFPDTTVKDFSNREFTEKLKKSQKKLIGYGLTRRKKPNFSFGMKVFELEDSGLSNIEKADKVRGVNTIDDAFMRSPHEDIKSKNRVKTARRRLKRRINLS